MNYEQFKTYVKDSMEAVTGERVEICPIVKNNSVVYDGLSVMPEGESMAVPTIYLEKYYECYQQGTPAPELVRDMVSFYETRKKKVGISPELFEDFSWLKDKVGYKLINRACNRGLLAKVPHRSFLDLEMVFYLLFLDGEMGDATMLIENQHLAMWGIGPDEICEAAWENMPRLLPASFRPMDMVMRDIYQSEIQLELKKQAELEQLELDQPDLEQMAEALVRTVQDRQQSLPMYVLTNNRGVYGASSLLYCDMFDRWAEEAQSDLFIIPSSIHEVLILPSSGFCSAAEISGMIREINRTQVAPEEILSDHVYIYQRNMGKITM